MIDCERNVAVCPIFRTMSPEEREAILQLAEHIIVERGRSVIEEGNSYPHGLFVIRSGNCEVVRTTPGTGEQQLAFLEPGAIFGEMSFFDPAEHSATIRVVNTAELMFFSLENYQRLETASPGAARKFVLNMGRILAQKLRRTDRMLTNRHYIVSNPLARA